MCGTLDTFLCVGLTNSIGTWPEYWFVLATVLCKLSNFDNHNTEKKQMIWLCREFPILEFWFVCGPFKTSLYSFCILYKISKFCLQSSFCWHISVFGSTKIEADFRHWCHSDILFLCFCVCYRIGESLLS